MRSSLAGVFARAEPRIKIPGLDQARINKMYREGLIAHEEKLTSTRRIKYSQLHEQLIFSFTAISREIQFPRCRAFLDISLQ